MPINIVFENVDLIVLNKPFGLQVEPDKNGHPSLLQEAIEHYKIKEDKKLFVVNRIDRPTSGLVIFAKKKKAYLDLQKQWAENLVFKSYLVVVNGSLELEEDDLRHFVVKDLKNYKALVYDEYVNSDCKEAILKYKILQKTDSQSLLEVVLKTGRYHQIRAQLAHIGHPVWNDVLYGAPKIIEEVCIGLHSYKNAFKLPSTQKEREFSSVPFGHIAFKEFDLQKIII